MQPLARADRGLGSAGRCSALGRAYRGAGADWPFGDPRRAHGVAMEGYYWRLWDDRSGRSVMALCGVCRAADGGRWAVVALAAHPGGLVRWVNASAAWADPAGLGVAAWKNGTIADPPDHGLSPVPDVGNPPGHDPPRV